MPYLSRSRRKSRKSRTTKSRKGNSIFATTNGNTRLHNVCNKNYFNNSIDTLVHDMITKYPFLVNTVNKNGETPLDLLCKQYNHPKNIEEFDNRQSLLSLIEDLQMSHNAELRTCSLGRSL